MRLKSGRLDFDTGSLCYVPAIGVDEIQYSKRHKHLTLVYQIDLGVTRLLWVGKERTIESFQGFFTTIGEEITSKIVFICSDMATSKPNPQQSSHLREFKRQR
jgi:transposase